MLIVRWIIVIFLFHILLWINDQGLTIIFLSLKINPLFLPCFFSISVTEFSNFAKSELYMTPWAAIAFATFKNPAMLAPAI